MKIHIDSKYKHHIEDSQIDINVIKALFFNRHNYHLRIKIKSFMILIYLLFISCLPLSIWAVIEIRLDNQIYLLLLSIAAVINGLITFYYFHSFAKHKKNTKKTSYLVVLLFFVQLSKSINNVDDTNYKKLMLSNINSFHKKNLLEFTNDEKNYNSNILKFKTKRFYDIAYKSLILFTIIVDCGIAVLIAYGIIGAFIKYIFSFNMQI